MASGRELSIWRLVGKSTKPIVPINADGNHIPFYCVHSIGGEVTSFNELAQLLGPEQRFYGIQAPRQKLSAEFASSIHSIAEYYVDALTAHQPEGPLALGGWSVGAVIALEMAQQLRANGRAVQLLVVLDGDLSNTSGEISALSPLYYWKLLSNLPRWVFHDVILDMQLRAIAKRAKRKLLGAMATLASRGEHAARYHPVDGFVDTTSWPETQILFARALYDAQQRYVPQAYDGPILVFAARTGPLHHVPKVTGTWDTISTRVETVRVDGTHLNMLRAPRALCVSNHLRERLWQLDASLQQATQTSK